MKSIPIALFLFTILGCTNHNKTAKQSLLFSNKVLQSAIIYEVNIRQFTKEGNFSSFQNYLPKLKNLGVDILWLMPIHPIGEQQRKGSLGSYYSIKDYKGINPEFGTLEDFKSLVNEAHSLGMFVILDWVAGHTAWDHPWLTQHPDWYLKDTKGDIIPPNPEWSDVAGLNFNNPQMLDALEDAMVYWVEELEVDGFRCDAAYNISIDFWNRSINRLNSIKPVFMLAESDGNHNGGYPLVEEFQMSYDWPGHSILNQIAKGSLTADDLADHLLSVQQNYSSSHTVMSFTTNHDENSWQGTTFERMGDAVEVMTALTYTMPGMPLIYNGQEYGLNKRLLFFEKDYIEKMDSPFKEVFMKLNSLKKMNRSLDVGQFPGTFELIEDNQEDILAFKRSKNEDELVFIANLSGASHKLNLKLTGQFINYMSNEKISLDYSEVLRLDPWSYMILVNHNP